MVVWMLRHQLLVQLHTYVYLLPHTSQSRPSAPRTRHTTLPSLLSPSTPATSMDLDSFLAIKRANSASDVASGQSGHATIILHL